MSHPHAFVVLYQGETVNSAVLVSASADPDLVRYVATELLARGPHSHSNSPSLIERARRATLRLISRFRK